MAVNKQTAPRQQESRDMRTVATFESPLFTLTLPDDGEGVEIPPGHDVALWLASELRLGHDIAVEEPQPEDFGWYLPFTVEGEFYHAVIGPVGDEFWYVVVERAAGFWASLLGGRQRHNNPAGVLCIHEVLANCRDIGNLKWHEWAAFKRGGAHAFDEGVDGPAFS